MQKPFEIEEIELNIEKSLDHRRMKHEIDCLRHTKNDIYAFNHIVGASGALQRFLSIVRKVDKSKTTVLIHGGDRHGKELIADAIHHNSPRASRNFVRVNYSMLEHEKGPLRAPTASASAGSSRRTPAASSSTRWAT